MTVIKGITNFGTPYYTDEPRYERKNGQWVDTKAGVIEELEKIKDKIKWEVNGQTGAFIKAYKVFDIIDNHISELKGE